MVSGDLPDLGAYAPGLEPTSLLDAATASFLNAFQGVLIADYHDES